MGSTVVIKSKRLALALALGLTITVTPALAATKSPTPTPKATATKKAPVKKPPAKKKAPVKKKKVSKVTPSPSPKWPPAGFKTDALGATKLYMKVPTAKELVGLLSAKTALSAQIKDCTKFTCGAVLVASEIGCRWCDLCRRSNFKDLRKNHCICCAQCSTKDRDSFVGNFRANWFWAYSLQYKGRL